MTTGEAPPIGVGLLGYAFMGKAHAHAYRTLAYLTWPPPLTPRLVRIAARDADAVAEAARRYGFDDHATDWRELIADDRVELFDNCAPNSLHAEPTIAAAEAGKHVVCEKPLGRTADESYEIWRRVAATGVTHMCAFNYRFVPAVRLARELLEAGELGEIRHFRASYLQSWLADPDFSMVWRLDKEQAGSGALGDLGTHVFDLARYLVGEIETVSGATRTFVPRRPGGDVTVDDAFESIVGLESGAIGTIEATRFALGRAQGFRRVLVSETDHPFWTHWWPPGHVLGWEHTFVHELHHLLSAIREDGDVEPHGASLRDGYRASEIADAVVRSEQTGARMQVAYRD